MRGGGRNGLSVLSTAKENGQQTEKAEIILALFWEMILAIFSVLIPICIVSKHKKQ